MIERRAGYEYAEGTIVESTGSFEFLVQLDDGRELVATLPKKRVRQIGYIPGGLASWRVVIVVRAKPKQSVILELKRPDR